MRCLYAPSVVALCCRLFRASRWDGDFDSPHLHDEVPLVFRAPPDFRPPAWVALMGRAAVCAGGRRPAREIATREPAARSGRSRGPPWPCRRPPAPRPGPASGGSPVPSGPSGALHTGGAWLLMLLGASARSPARPRRPRPPQPGPPVPCGPSGALPTGGVWSASISHAIPLELL